MIFWKKLVILLSSSFFCSFIMVSFLGSKVNPILINYLNTEVERVTSNVIDVSINDLLAKEIDNNLISISRNNDNEVEMIDYNSKEVNLLLKKVNQVVYSKLLQLEEGKIDDFDLSSSLSGTKYRFLDSGIVCEIPFGSLTGNGFLSNLGPIIPINISFMGQVSSSLETKVTSYGINNLLLELFVHVEINERISLPKSSDEVVIKVDAPISVQVISGVVPEYYGGVIGKNSQTTFFLLDD